MNNILAFVLLLPLIIWSSFQPILFINASMVQQSVNLALYEGEKQAALQGHYDNQIYSQMKSYLVNVHHYDPNKIKIQGTETLTPRGKRMYVKITVPKPMLSVIDIFSFNKQKPFVEKKYIMSEYVP